MKDKAVPVGLVPLAPSGKKTYILATKLNKMVYECNPSLNGQDSFIIYY